MADRKTSTTKNEDTDALRAGVSAEAEKDARKESREVADDEVLSQHAAELEDRDLDEPTLLKELPEDGMVADTGEELRATAVSSSAPYGRTFEDNFSGLGGTFVIDPASGDRKRQYEAVRDRKNPDKIVGYRPAV
jgi:hypothetical protein